MLGRGAFEHLAGGIYPRAVVVRTVEALEELCELGRRVAESVDVDLVPILGQLAVGVVKFLDVRAFERGRGGDRGFVARVETRHEGVRHVLVVVAGQHEQQGLHGVLVVLADLGAARRITLRVGLAAGAASRGERYAYIHVERLLLVRSHRIGTDRFVVAAARQDRHGECAGQKMFPAFHDFVYCF